MLLCMRTTIDLPDSLLKRLRPILAERNMTLRSFVIDSIEQAMRVEPTAFRLRDASAGYDPQPGESVSSEAINRAIDNQRQRHPST